MRIINCCSWGYSTLNPIAPRSLCQRRKPEMKKSPSKDQASWMLFDIDS